METSHFEFEWDKGNKTKNVEKHNVSISEVEAVFRSGLARPAHKTERRKYEEILRKIT